MTKGRDVMGGDVLVVDDEEEAVDPATVTAEMRRRGTLARVGAAFPMEVAQHFISVSSLDYHLDAVAARGVSADWRRDRLRPSSKDG